MPRCASDPARDVVFVAVALALVEKRLLVGVVPIRLPTRS